jgi:glycerol-3-phosphate acyltransferase PlsY
MVLDVLRIAAPLVVGYLVGGIPFSLIVGRKFFGIDPREHGSGNLGATNVYRVLGARPALAVALLDVGKGAAAVALAMLVSPFASGDARDYVLIAVAMTAVLGHSFSPYIRFKGGKGVATAAGAIAVVMPLTWPILFITFVLVITLSRMVSLASILVALEFPLLTWLLYRDHTAFVVFAAVAATLVIARHRTNIVRIWRGEENRVSFDSRTAAGKVLLEAQETSDGASASAAGISPDVLTDFKDTEG